VTYRIVDHEIKVAGNLIGGPIAVARDPEIARRNIAKKKLALLRVKLATLAMDPVPATTRTSSMRGVRAGWEAEVRHALAVARVIVRRRGR
jgi:hypothetical protein